MSAIRTMLFAVLAATLLVTIGCDSGTKKVASDNAAISDNDLLLSDEDGLIGDGDDLITDEQSEGGQDSDFAGQDNDFIGQDSDFAGQDNDFIGQDSDFAGQDDDFVGDDATDDDIVPPTCGNGQVDFGELCDGNTIECTAIDAQLYSGGKALCAGDCLGWNTVTCYEIATDDDTVVTDDGVASDDTMDMDMVDEDIQPDIDTVTPVIDTVGSTARNSTGQNRMRGDFYSCDTSRTLTNIEVYLDYTGAATVYFDVYESTAIDGTYTSVTSVQQDLTMTGAGFYSSGTVSIPLTAGTFYYIGARWGGVNMGYASDNNPTSYPTAFGDWVSGMMSNTGTAPANFTYNGVTNASAYYQRLTTE